MSRTFFTADHHFGHENIIRFCGRPFTDIHEHDEHLVDAWNSVVQPDDVVWHLGDFAYRGDKIGTRRIFERLNGVKHLIVGNHDKPFVRQLPWTSVGHMADIVVEGQRIILCHYGLRVWNAMRHGTIHLYGHSHGNLPGSTLSCDVGVDVWGFHPIDLQQIKARLATLPPVFKPDVQGLRIAKKGFGGGFTIEHVHEPVPEVIEGNGSLLVPAYLNGDAVYIAPDFKQSILEFISDESWELKP